MNLVASFDPAWAMFVAAPNWVWYVVLVVLVVLIMMRRSRRKART